MGIKVHSKKKYNIKIWEVQKVNTRLPRRKIKIKRKNFLRSVLNWTKYINIKVQRVNIIKEKETISTRKFDEVPQLPILLVIGPVNRSMTRAKDIKINFIGSDKINRTGTKKISFIILIIFMGPSHCLTRQHVINRLYLHQ